MRPALGLAWALPISDWQFWLASALALLALAWLLRGVVPIPIVSARRARNKRTHRVTLTIAGKTATPKRRAGR